jgi:protein gp37
MAENSAIEWCDHTFNPVWGCVKVSPACDNCYAETLSNRFGDHWGPHAEFRTFGDKHWNEPRKWDRAAEKAGRRARVFCASMADVFDNRWPDGVRDRLWALIRETPHLDWLLLTKRPQNIAKMLPADWRDGYPNVWLGTTVENQDEADRRIPYLRSVPARVRFLSCEPLLGQIYPDMSGIHWVICGGESGPNARPMHPDWARSLRDQCAQAGVAFQFKQWGEWAPEGPLSAGGWALASDGTLYRQEDLAYPDGARRGEAIRANHNNLAAMYRVGKKRAGRLLDGREHSEFPVVDAADAIETLTRERDELQARAERVEDRCSQWADLAGKHGAAMDVWKARAERAEAALMEIAARAKDGGSPVYSLLMECRAIARAALAQKDAAP